MKWRKFVQGTMETRITECISTSCTFGESGTTTLGKERSRPRASMTTPNHAWAIGNTKVKTCHIMSCSRKETMSMSLKGRPWQHRCFAHCSIQQLAKPDSWLRMGSGGICHGTRWTSYPLFRPVGNQNGMGRSSKPEGLKVWTGHISPPDHSQPTSRGYVRAEVCEQKLRSCLTFHEENRWTTILVESLGDTNHRIIIQSGCQSASLRVTWTLEGFTLPRHALDWKGRCSEPHPNAKNQEREGQSQ